MAGVTGELRPVAASLRDAGEVVDGAVGPDLARRREMPACAGVGPDLDRLALEPGVRAGEVGDVGAARHEDRGRPEPFDSVDHAGGDRVGQRGDGRGSQRRRTTLEQNGGKPERDGGGAKAHDASSCCGTAAALVAAGRSPV